MSNINEEIAATSDIVKVFLRYTDLEPFGIIVASSPSA